MCIIPSSITATINAFLAEAMEKLPEASTMQEATQSVSEDVSADDGTTIKEEEIKPSEGQQEEQQEEAEPKGINDNVLLRIFLQNKDRLREFLQFCKVSGSKQIKQRFEAYSVDEVQNEKGEYRNLKELHTKLQSYGYLKDKEGKKIPYNTFKSYKKQ